MTSGPGFLFPVKFAIGIVTYNQFILEETVQSGLMGCYIAANNGHIGVMDKVIDRLERVTLPKLHDFNNRYGCIAFFNQDAFNAFWKAGKLAVEAYKECR